MTESLKAISESHGTHRIHSVEHNLLCFTMGLGLLTAAAIALSLLLKDGDKLWDQVQATRLATDARRLCKPNVLGVCRRAVNHPVSGRMQA